MKKITKYAIFLMAAICYVQTTYAFESSTSCTVATSKQDPSSTSGSATIGTLLIAVPGGDESAVLVQNSSPAAVIAKNILVAGQSFSSINLTGTAKSSAKGLWFDLQTQNSEFGVKSPQIKLTIAASASHSNSEIIVDGKTYELLCNW